VIARSAIKALAIIALTVVVAGVSAADPKRVFILHSFGPAFADAYAKQLRSELDRQLPGRLELYEDWLVSARFGTAKEETAFASYLQVLFADHPIDLVITIGAPAARFVAHNRHILFTATPELLTDVEQRRLSDLYLTANDTAVPISVSIPTILDNILRVLPQTGNIAIVIGSSPIEKYWATQIRNSLQPLSDRLTVTWLSDLSFDDLLKRASTLPPRSAILYFALSQVVPGISLDEDLALARLHAAANAPMFSIMDPYLGKGIVGGPLISEEELSRKTVDLAVRILQGEHAGEMRVPAVQFAAPQFDWRELQRWHIRESDLPPGSIIRFRGPTAWEQYRWAIVVIVVFILLQTTLIGALLYERRRRRSLEMEAHRRLSELARMNRRSAVGELSASLAHEVFQPLTSAMSNADAAELIVPPNLTELKEILSDVKRDVGRASEVIAGLRRLLAKAPAVLKELDLNELVREVFKFLATPAAERRVELAMDLDPRAPRVRGDRTQIQQVILNLVLNAVEAVAMTATAKRQIVGRTLVLDATFVEVSISDSGPGIAMDKIKDVFEPFFTSKEGGMGMGLAIARSIVESHGGSIVAENIPDGGALFRLRLRIAKGT